MKINNKIINILFIILILLLTASFTVSNNELNEVSNELDKVQVQFETIKDELNIKTEQLELANTTISDLKNSAYKLIYVGDFKITYYCDERYNHICGGTGITASGKLTEVGVTAAADWSILPKGSIIYIEGVGFREIQDVGGGVNGNHIDVLVQNHQEALNLGTNNNGVWLLVDENS